MASSSKLGWKHTHNYALHKQHIAVQQLTWFCILEAAYKALPPGAAHASRMVSPGWGSSKATTKPAASSCTCTGCHPLNSAYHAMHYMDSMFLCPQQHAPATACAVHLLPSVHVYTLTLAASLCLKQFACHSAAGCHLQMEPAQGVPSFDLEYFGACTGVYILHLHTTSMVQITPWHKCPSVKYSIMTTEHLSVGWKGT